MELSIVTSLYHSAPFLPEFYRRASEAAQKITRDYEIIFVNDGSPDGSLDLARDFQQIDPHVVVVDLARNFGHHRALMTGLAYSRGSKVFLIDCDLEENPDSLTQFAEMMESTSSDLVYGVQDMRRDSLPKRLGAVLFYFVFNLLSRTRIPKNVYTVRLMTRRYVEALLRHKEREVNIAGLFAITGFKQSALSIRKISKSTTTYTLPMKIEELLLAVTAFSNKPLIFISQVGLVICVLAAIYIARLLFLATVYGIPVPGYASLIVSIWFLGGLTHLFIGIVGLYIARVYMETKQRPYVLVRDVYSKEPIRKLPEFLE